MSTKTNSVQTQVCDYSSINIKSYWYFNTLQLRIKYMLPSVQVYLNSWKCWLLDVLTFGSADNNLWGLVR